VLKTLGFSDASIFTSVLCEAAVITLAGGVPGALVAKYVLERSGFSLPAFPPLFVHWDTVALGIGVAALMGAVSGFVPAWQASRLKIVDALRKVG
jgi:putative ABC transport system permease protein